MCWHWQGRVFRLRCLASLTCGSALAIEARMKQTRRNFTPSDDVILEQPVTHISLKNLAAVLHASQETIMRRADELGVSLTISDYHDGTIDTRAIRCSDGLVDPLLERLKKIHGDRI